MNKEDASDLIRAKEVSIFERWLLPDLDSNHVEDVAVEPGPEPEAAEEETVTVEDGPVEEVKPLTLEELEAIRQEAYNEDFTAGERDGFHSGQVRARQEAEVALTAKLRSLEIVMEQLLEPIAQQDRELEQALVRLVEHVTKQVIQRELKDDSTQLQRILREALKLLPMGAENILPDRHDERWKLLEDENLLPGGCRIESENSVIDASIETRLAQALTQIMEQQRHQATQPADPDLHIPLEDAADAS